MYSGLRNGIRIAQGTNIKMTLKAEVAVQVDGEPWMQPPGKIVITPAAMQVTRSVVAINGKLRWFQWFRP